MFIGELLQAFFQSPPPPLAALGGYFTFHLGKAGYDLFVWFHSLTLVSCFIVHPPVRNEEPYAPILRTVSRCTRLSGYVFTCYYELEAVKHRSFPTPDLSRSRPQIAVAEWLARSLRKLAKWPAQSRHVLMILQEHNEQR